MKTRNCSPIDALQKRILSLQEVKNLIERLEKKENRACAAAVVLMLWGNVGYKALREMKWSDVWDFGTKHRSALPVQLVARLGKLGYLGIPEAPVLPRGWNRRWLRLKQELAIKDASVLHATHAYYSTTSQEQGPSADERAAFWSQMWD